MKTKQQLGSETRKQYLTKARRYAARKLREQRNENQFYRHDSFNVAEALRLTEARFVDMGTFGVESITSVNGDETYGLELQYLNSGEMYCLTLCFDETRNCFLIACVGNMIEAAEAEARNR